MRTPVIILSAHTNKGGALRPTIDAYVAKPFHKEDLVLPMLAAVRRFRGEGSRIVTGELVIDLDGKTAGVAGAAVSLTSPERPSGNK